MNTLPSFEQRKATIKNVQVFMPEEFLRLLDVEGLRRLALDVAYEMHCQAMPTQQRGSELITVGYTPAPDHVVQVTRGVVSGGFVAMCVRGYLTFTYVENEQNKEEFIQGLLRTCQTAVTRDGGDFQAVHLDSEQN